MCVRVCALLVRQSRGWGGREIFPEQFVLCSMTGRSVGRHWSCRKRTRSLFVGSYGDADEAGQRGNAIWKLH